jgi:predicted ArsR family transcriptional regulator
MAKTERLRDRILALLADGSELTPDEMAERLGANIMAVRPRVSDLAKDQLIVRTGDRRKNPIGQRAAVWRILP